MGKKIRILLTKTGLDAHTRGVKIIARALRDSGMEVIYLGPYQTPEQIVSTAIQEDVDVIGISSIVGAHMSVFPEILRLLEENRVTDCLLVGGGIIPKDEAESLKKMGVSEIFRIGTRTDDVVRYIHDTVNQKAVARS